MKVLKGRGRKGNKGEGKEKEGEYLILFMSFSHGEGRKQMIKCYRVCKFDGKRKGIKLVYFVDKSFWPRLVQEIQVLSMDVQKCH